MIMKKTGQIAIVALLSAAALSSCKKDYTCACKVAVEAYTEGDSTTGIITVEAQDTVVSYSYDGVSKSDAKSRCDGSQATLSTQYKEFFEDHASVNCEVE
jgi:hypothetical protein